MSYRRLFWQGAAVVLVLGGLLAISAVFGAGAESETWKALATLGLALVCGSAALAGLACLERGVAQAVALPGVVVAGATFVLWTEEVWAGHDSTTYWKLLGILGSWTVAALVATALRLVSVDPRVVRRLYRPTALAAAVGALVASVMILRENGDGWQLLAVLGILTGLGSLMTPIAQKLLAAQARPRDLRAVAAAGRLELLAGSSPTAGDGDVVVSLVRGRLRVRAGGRELELGSGEALVVRSRR